MKLGIDRLAGQEQKCRFGGLAGQDVFSRDVVDMFDHVRLEGARGEGPVGVVFGAAQGAIARQGKLCVDDDGAGRIGQGQQAVAAAVVAQGRLKAVGRRRQRVDDDIVELDFPKGAARLFVGQHILERHHLAAEFDDILLRRIDLDQSFAQIGHGLGGLLG